MIKKFELRDVKEHEPTTVVDLVADEIYHFLLFDRSYKRVVSRSSYEGRTDGTKQWFFAELQIVTDQERRHPDYDVHLHFRVIWINHVQPLRLEVEVTGDVPAEGRNFLLVTDGQGYTLIRAS